MRVWNMRLNCRGSVRSQCSRLAGMLARPARRTGLWSRWSARKRSLQWRQSTSGSVKPSTCPDASHTRGWRMIDESRATMSSRSRTIASSQRALTFSFMQHAVVPVVVRRAEAAVDLRRREHEPAAARERDDLVHRDGVGHRRDVTHRGAARIASPRGRPGDRRSREAVELHIVSDSTGETAARLVLALEAQFPDQPFVEIRHPRVENAEDLHIAVQQARGRPAVMVYTLVEPELRDVDAPALPARPRPLLRPPRASDRLDLARRGSRRPDDARACGAARRPVLQAHRGDRVRREVRRRRRARARRGGHRARRRLAHLQDAALDLPRVPGPQGRERARRARDRSPEELFEIDPAKIVGLTIDAERLADIRTARVRSMGAPRQALRRAGGDLRRARGGVGAPPAAPLPVIDVSELSVEETATRIIRLVGAPSPQRPRARRATRTGPPGSRRSETLCARRRVGEAICGRRVGCHRGRLAFWWLLLFVERSWSSTCC